MGRRMRASSPFLNASTPPETLIIRHGRRHHDNTITVAMRPVRAHLRITKPTCVDKQESELFYWALACMMHASMRER